MPQEPTRPAAGTGPAEQVRARVAATNPFLVRSRLRASQAMAQVRYVDRLLHATSQRSDAAEQADGTGSEHLIEVIEHEVAAHLRALTLHEAAAQLQEDAGWPKRAAAGCRAVTVTPLSLSSNLMAWANDCRKALEAA